MDTIDSTGSSRKPPVYDNDVVVTEDSQTLPENEKFLRIIRERQPEYASKSQLEKPMVAVDILNQWRQQGGRFLRKDSSDGWEDMSDKKARRFISKLLRSEKLFINNDDDDGSPSETTSESKSRRVSTRLAFSREGKLYGRSREREELLKSYSRLKQSSTPSVEFVLVSGETGIGKSALAQSIQSCVAQDEGFFVKAKFEQLESPESSTGAFIMAFSDFANQLSHRNPETIHLYRSRIQKAIDEEGRLLTSLVPELESVLGQQDKLVVESGHGSQATERIKYVLRSFLNAISSAKHPLVILLDDLHWASTASFEVLSSLACSLENAGVMFIATYRDESIDVTHLDNLLEKLRCSKAHFQKIELGNLEEDDVRDMLAGGLLLESEQLRTVSHVVTSQTHGNVFFILELLRSLQDESLLEFDEATKQWTCDSHIIQVAVEARTIHDIFKAKLSDLPAAVQEMLKFAASLGSRIDQVLLQQLVSTDNVASHLHMAAARGLLIYDSTMGAFSFAHDGIQQETYALIASDARESFHLKIGRRLWQMLDEDSLEKYMFVVLRQLMLGDRLVTDQKERNLITSLCLQAGEKAVRLSTFETASVYLRHGISLLGPRKWKDNYVRSLQLYNAAAEVSYCIARFDDVEKFVEAVLLNARTFQDTLHARATQIYALGSRGRLPEAIENGLSTLENLGEKLPADPSVAQLLFSMWRTNRLLRNRSDECILRLPAMSNVEKIAAMQILNLIWLSALYSRPLLAGLVAIRMVRLTVTHGICAASCAGFGFYAMLLCSGGSNIDEGYRYGKLAMQINSALKTEAWLSRVSAAFYGCVSPWKEHVVVTFEPLKHAYHVALGTGDIEFAVLCASLNIWNNSDRFPLPVIEKEIKGLAERMSFLGQNTALLFVTPVWQFVQNFMGRARGDPTILTGEVMNQEDLTAAVKDTSPGIVVWIRFYCMVLSYFFGEYDAAEKYSTTSHEIYDHSYGGMDAGSVLFYECMTLLASCPDGTHRNIRAVRRRLRKLSHWARHCPLNFLGKQYLIEAELATITGNLSALGKYTCAILLAREGGFFMEEALANERAGKYHLARGDEASALPFLRNSYKIYDRWGGTEKMRHLREELAPLDIST